MIVFISACVPDLMVPMLVELPPHSEVEAILMQLDFLFRSKLTGPLQPIRGCLVRSRIAAELHNLGPP